MQIFQFFDLCVQGVRVLVEDIGADVNVGGGRGEEEVAGKRETMAGEQRRRGHTDHTPICLAVLSEKKSMVELLLELGVTHVHPALRLARELKLDEIVGLLLKNLGLDRNGETVNLSGLELQSVKPQWILPCLGVNETLRISLQRRPSLDRIKDLLLRRKSIGCIEDKNLDQLRTKMEALLMENREGLLSEGDEEEKGGDEPDFDLPESSSSQPYLRGHRRTQSDNANIRLTKLKDMSSLTPPQPRREIAKRSNSLPPEEPMLETPALPLSLPPTPTKSGPKSTSTPVKHRAPGGMSLGFQPTLPPICGTPVGSLHRVTVQLSSSHSGDIMESPTSPLVPPSPVAVGGGAGLFPGGRISSRGTLVLSAESDHPQPPRTPQRRHHDKLNSLMIQKSTAAQRELFPISPTHHHPLPKISPPMSINDVDGFKVLNAAATLLPKKVSNVSPSVLLRRITMWGKKKAQPGVIKRSGTTGSLSRPSSPVARIFTDLTAVQSTSGESRDSTPVPSDFKRPRTLARVPTDEGIGTGPTPAHAAHNITRLTPNSGHFPLSPGSDSTDGGEGGSLFSPTSSSTTTTTFRGLSHRRRKSSSSLSSSSISGNQWSDDSRNGAGENSLVFAAKFPSRASSEVREKITSARLVKALDLSSNLLTGLEEMVGEGGGGREERERGKMVCQRLRGLQRLDLKQNRLSRLPRCLMAELTKLGTLNLSCNGFEELPAECVLSPSLSSLDLSTNKVGFSHAKIPWLYVHAYACLCLMAPYTQ